MNRIEIAAPGEARAAFEERLLLRLQELAGDLALPVPDVSWTTDPAAPAVTIDGHPVLPPMERTVALPLRARAERQAEAVAAALIRHRWRLLAPALPETDLPLRDVASAGLDAADLRALHAAGPASAAELGLLAAERHPPTVELLLSRRDLPSEDISDFVAAAVQSLADSLGIPVPRPAIAADPGLEPGAFRLRVGKVRGRVQPERWDGDDATRVRQALRRHAAEFFDAGSLLALMSEPDRMPAEVARAVLAEVDAATLATALRRLLASGIGLVDPLLIAEAVLQPAIPLGDPAGLPLALPGALVLTPSPNASELDRRLRAKLVPAHLLRTGPALGSLPSFRLAPAVEQRVRDGLSFGLIQRLAAELAPRLTGEDRLTVAADLAEPLRDALADPLRDLLVIAIRELPPGRRPRSRGTIELKETPG